MKIHLRDKTFEASFVFGVDIVVSGRGIFLVSCLLAILLRIFLMVVVRCFQLQLLSPGSPVPRRGFTDCFDSIFLLVVVAWRFPECSFCSPVLVMPALGFRYLKNANRVLFSERIYMLHSRSI